MAIFDHSHALYGYMAGQGITRLETLTGRLGMSGGPGTGGNRHCLLDALSTAEHFQEWINRTRAIPEFLIDDICNEVVGPGLTSEEAAKAKDFLNARKSNIIELLNTHREEFKNLAEWRILV
jgi:hypothetical protein